MRASIAPAALLTLAMAGCAGDVPTAPSPAAAAVPPPVVTAAAQALSQPIKGECEATYAAPPIVTPPILRHVSVGTCSVSHLGQAILRTEAQLNLATGVQVAETTLTAANGDRLDLSSVGTGTPSGPTTVHFTGTASILGGTGRFANASGEMAVEGTVNNATGGAQFTYDGWITYDASDRGRR